MKMRTLIACSSSVLFIVVSFVTGPALIQASYQTANPQQYLQMVIDIWPFIAKGQARDGGMYWQERDPAPNRGISATGSDTEIALPVSGEALI